MSLLGLPGPFTDLPACPALSWALADKPEHTGCSFALQGFVEITFHRQARPGTGVFCAETMVAFSLGISLRLPGSFGPARPPRQRPARD